MFIHSSIGGLLGSTLWLLWTMLLWTLTYSRGRFWKAKKHDLYLKEFIIRLKREEIPGKLTIESNNSWISERNTTKHHVLKYIRQQTVRYSILKVGEVTEGWWWLYQGERFCAASGNRQRLWIGRKERGGRTLTGQVSIAWPESQA